MNFDNICIFHKHLRPTCGAERKFVKKKITEANFSNLVSYLLYAYQKKSTEKLLAKSILWAKLDMRILQRVALKGKRYLFFAYDKYMPYSYLLKTHGAPYAQKQLTAPPLIEMHTITKLAK